MSVNQETDGLGLDAPEDDGQMIDGLEQLVANVRSKVDAHSPDSDSEFGAAALGTFSPTAGAVTEQPPIDTSAVMDVLHDAIERYATADSAQGGEWVGPPPGDGLPPVHPVVEHRRDRRRMLAFIVVLLFLFGGVAFATLGGGGDSKVKTTPTVPTGQSVTTATREVPTSVATVPLETAPPETEPPAPSVTSKPSTTPRRAPATTAPPETAPVDPCVADPSLPECQPPTTETVPPTTETTTTTSTDSSSSIIPPGP